MGLGMARRVGQREYGAYRVILGGEWLFEDLYRFPRTFEQVYYVMLSLSEGVTSIDTARVTKIMRHFRD